MLQPLLFSLLLAEDPAVLHWVPLFNAVLMTGSAIAVIIEIRKGISRLEKTTSTLIKTKDDHEVRLTSIETFCGTKHPEKPEPKRSIGE